MKKVIEKIKSNKALLLLSLLITPIVAFALIGLYWKLVRFILTFVFPCRISEYYTSCMGANMFAMYATFITIMLVIFFVYKIIND